MALYYNGQMVAGVNFVPRYTLAAYNLLSIKPDFWIRTDAPESYGRLPAEEVGYDNTESGLTAEDAQAAIDELNSKIDTVYLTDSATITSMPFTKSLAGLTASHRPISLELGTPSAQNGDWNVTTSDGSYTITGTLVSGATTTVELGFLR